jgi:hypothetical protein
LFYSKEQCCRSRSRPGFNGVPGSVSRFEIWIRIPEGKMTHKHRKKLIKFHFSARCSLFRAEGFSCIFDKNKLQFLIKKRKKYFCCIFFLPYLVINTLDLDWIRIRIHLKCWIRYITGSGFIHNSEN